MKFYRCPWCGEKGIVPSPPKFGRNRFYPDDDIGCGHCNSCGQQYHDSSGSYSKVYNILLLVYIVGILTAFILRLFLGNDNKVLNICTIVLVTTCFIGMTIIHFRKPIYERYSAFEKCIVPFEYSFKAKIRFLSLKEGGVFRRKKRFYNGAILAAKFDYQEKEMNKYIYKNSVAIAFDDINYNAATATCKAAFILDEKIDKSFLKKGLKFSLMSNEGTRFAVGTVTDVIPSQNTVAAKNIGIKKRKNWQDPNYFI